MSSIKDLRENPKNIVNVTKIIENILHGKKSKYVELLLRLITDLTESSMDYEPNNDELNRYNITFTDETTLEKLFTLLIIRSTFSSTEDGSDYDEFNEIMYFCDVHDENRLPGIDTQRVTVDEICEINTLQKKRDRIKTLESEVIKLLDNDQWTIVVPLTYESSMKYGANTKWCTTNEDSDIHFLEYTSNGLLIYIINKVDKVKHAIHFNTQDAEFGTSNITLWNEEDDCVELLLTYFPPIVLDTIRPFLDDKQETTNHEILQKTMLDKAKSRNFITEQNKVRTFYDIETRGGYGSDFIGKMIADEKEPSRTMWETFTKEDVDNENNDAKWIVSRSPFGFNEYLSRLNKDK